MITDDEYRQWLRKKEAPRVVLAKLKYAYEDAGDVAEGELWFGSRDYITEPGDTPANQPCPGVISEAPTFWRQIDVLSLGGIARFAVASDLALGNADGRLDHLLDRPMDGWEIEYYLGPPNRTLGWELSDFRRLLVTVMERVTAPSPSKIAVKQRDKRLLLAQEIKGDPVGGSGPDATKYGYLLWGSHQNLRPLLYDESNLEYHALSNYAGSSAVALKDVRDGGLSLDSGVMYSGAGALGFTVDAGTNVFAKVAHGFALNDVVGWEINNNVVDLPIAWYDPYPGMSPRPYWINSVPDADHFTISATRGGSTLDITSATFSNPFTTMRVRRARYFDNTAVNGRFLLSSKAEAELTYDILSMPVDFSTGLPFGLARSLMETYGNLTAGEIDSDAFDDADAALSAKIDTGYINLAVLERQNLISVLNELVDASFGWIGDNGQNQITCGLLDPSHLDAATPDYTLSAGEVLEMLGVENLPPTIDRVNVSYDVNHTVQREGLLADVTDEDRAKYGAEYNAIQRSTAPSGTTYAGNPGLYHKTMTEGAPRTAAFMSSYAYGDLTSLDIGDYADEIVADRRPNLRTINVAVGIDKYDWALGKVVELTYPRYGLDAGKNLRLVGIGLDPLKQSVEFQLLGYFEPTLTEATP